jgi:hypothetical protein
VEFAEIMEEEAMKVGGYNGAMKGMRSRGLRKK